MTATASNASVPSLPPEIWRMIVPRPRDLLGDIISSANAQVQSWLPIKLSWEASEDQDAHRAEAVESMIRTLRVLSKTSSMLRDIALPLLWECCHVRTVRELGQLREVLKASPYLAAYIRTFCFLWRDEEIDAVEAYPSLAGSLLEHAFRDRKAAWKAYADMFNCKIQRNAQGERGYYLNMQWVKEPGQPSNGKPRRSSNGPDGTGEDALIKDADQLKSSINSVIARLSSLHAFGWHTHILPVPAEAFNALAKLNTLNALHFDFATHRKNHHYMPYWELAGNLEALSFWTGDDQAFLDIMGDLCEDYAESYEPPGEPQCYLFPGEGAYAHHAIAVRTIIAAARGGRLKLLDVGYFYEGYDMCIQSPFTLIELLPHWIGIERWWSGNDHAVTYRRALPVWPGAAESLRSLLSYASLWLGNNKIAKPRLDQRLTCTEIQSLSAYFQQREAALEVIGWGNPCVTDYLTWLEEDAAASQQLADAWNAML